MNIKQEDVKKVIETKVRPRLHEHGGDLDLIRIDQNGIIYVSFYGSCRFCPAAQDTIENIVASILREELGDSSIQVHLINDVNSDLLELAKSIIKH